MENEEPEPPEKRPVFWRSRILPPQRIPKIGKPVAETTGTLQGTG
jgi:hypothetical protein